jgi:hypothetical protein
MIIGLVHQLLAVEWLGESLFVFESNFSPGLSPNDIAIRRDLVVFMQIGKIIHFNGGSTLRGLSFMLKNLEREV